MNKYKICPECKKKNEPYVIECIYCEADLTGVKITDEETENTEQNNTNVQTPVVMKMIRLCDCGNKNPANARISVIIRLSEGLFIVRSRNSANTVRKSILNGRIVQSIHRSPRFTWMILSLNNTIIRQPQLP